MEEVQLKCEIQGEMDAAKERKREERGGVREGGSKRRGRRTGWEANGGRMRRGEVGMKEKHV